MLMLFPPERVAEERHILDRIAGGERIDHFETRGIKKDGERIQISVTISPIRDANARIVGASTIARDISERKRAEEALRNAEKRYRTTLDNMMEGCQILSSDWRYLYVNDVAAAHGKRKREELLGHTMMEIYPGIEQSEVYSHIKRCMEEHVPHRLENEFSFPDGTKSWFHLTIEPVPEGAFILSEDITKEKELNEELRRHREHLEELVVERTAQLAAANKELEAFSYSVSHDLRAPLRSIDGFSQALLEDYADKVGEQGKDYLNRVRSSSQRMAQLIDDLLNLSRVTRAEMHTEEVDLSEIAIAVARELKKTDPDRRVEFKIDREAIARGDARLLRVVIDNLLGNAWKYTSKHGSAKIGFGITHQDGQSVYFVQDDGAGFDMKYSQKLFGAFQRLHGTTDFPGTGIGLATVQRIINRHGGRIWAEGNVERGATFYFTLTPGRSTA